MTIHVRAERNGDELNIRSESGQNIRVILGGGGALVTREGSDDVTVFDSWEEAVKAAASLPHSGGVLLSPLKHPSTPAPAPARSPSIPAPARLRSFEGAIETGSWKKTAAALVRELNKRDHDAPTKWASTGLVKTSIPEGATDRYEKVPGGWVSVGLSAKATMETLEKMVRDFGYKPTRWTLEWEDGTITHIGKFHPKLPTPKPKTQTKTKPETEPEPGLPPRRNTPPQALLPADGGRLPTGSWRKTFTTLIEKLDTEDEAAEKWLAHLPTTAPRNRNLCVKVKGDKYVGFNFSSSILLKKMAATLEAFGHSPSEWRLEWEDGSASPISSPQTKNGSQVNINTN